MTRTPSSAHLLDTSAQQLEIPTRLPYNTTTADDDSPKPLRVDTDLLIPGRGEPIKNPSLIYTPTPTPSGKGVIHYAVATRLIQVNSIQNPQNMTPESYAKLLAVERANKSSYELAIKAGTTCTLGTDLGISSTESHFTHGMNGLEFGYAVECGMTPLQAIEAGTANAPFTLGTPGEEDGVAPLSGQLREGYDADFIAVSEDSVRRIGVLGEVGKTVGVWKGGMRAKG